MEETNKQAHHQTSEKKKKPHEAMVNPVREVVSGLAPGPGKGSCPRSGHWTFKTLILSAAKAVSMAP